VLTSTAETCLLIIIITSALLQRSSSVRHAPAAMEGLPKVHSDHHLGEGVSATPSVVPSRTEDDKFAAESDPALGALAGKLHRFAVRNHRFFASFAAAKYTKHGPGALFVFGNSGLEHTLAEEGDGKCYEEATSCERQAVLVWGGITDRAAPDCALEDFTKRCVSETASLRRSVEVGCDRTTFPLVLCAGLQYATDDVREGLRPPRWKKKDGEGKLGGKGKYPGAGGCAVLTVQYGDFRAALTMGLKMGLEDALVVELDREED